MNPGDRISVHIFDANCPAARQSAERRVIHDLTTGQSGFMIASARNGFMATSFKDCIGTPFNYQPEYNTARAQNIVPWAALETNISTEFEIGHFEPCTRVTTPTPLRPRFDRHHVAELHRAVRDRHVAGRAPSESIRCTLLPRG